MAGHELHGRRPWGLAGEEGRGQGRGGVGRGCGEEEGREGCHEGGLLGELGPCSCMPASGLLVRKKGKRRERKRKGKKKEGKLLKLEILGEKNKRYFMDLI
jgi:hypothetical protein